MFKYLDTQAGEFQWHKDSSEQANQVLPPNALLSSNTGEVPDKYSNSGVFASHTHDNNEWQPQNSLNSEALSTTPRVVPYELTSQERDSALLRYKEKKKTRRYYYDIIMLPFFLMHKTTEI